jgi:Mn-dependent DtxR family transcriptional regulator
MGTGIHGFLFRMSKLKLVQRTSPGSYKITEKGQKIFGKKEATSLLEKKLDKNSNFYKNTNNYSGFRLMVLTTLNKEGDMRSTEMKQRVVDAGFSEKNLSTTGMKLRNEGLINVDEDGWYHLTDKGKQVMDNRPSLENDNGPDHNQEGIEANG